MARRVFGIATLIAMTLATVPARAAGGAWDKRFGTTGFARVKLDTLSAMAVQKDGKIVTAGWTRARNLNFGVARHTASGAPDTSFARGKTLSIDFGAEDRAFGVAVAPNGKIIVAGSKIEHGGSGSTSSLAVARLTSKGALDSSFGDRGKVTTRAFDFVDAGSFTGALAVQPDGKILVAGNSTANVFFNMPAAIIVRFEVDGSLDSTFGVGGVAPVSFGNAYINRVRVLPDGKIAYTGGVQNGNGPQGRNLLVGRALSTGESDPQFGFNGEVVIDFAQREDWGTGLAPGPGGSLFVAGLAVTKSGVHQAALLKLKSDGSFDTSFSKDGRVFTNIGPEGSPYDLVMQSDGKPLVAWSACEGRAIDCYFAAITRFTRTGAVDTSYGVKGVARPWGKRLAAFPIGRGAHGGALAFQKGKLLVAGSIFSTMGVARLS